ncbi:cryptochrome/photolyase family protein [Paenalkalicoccus suaedae]|uniref:Cryptochrome/photolyase family protein n=1 Tax=Paenalkalicoccus suaedae TaxID=2592382 RepID=A0A859FIB4_9BACI|nr:cryptochrome/photolyase family protein [Paenalkalicoccus suaedae]QKS72897.1 cryptochrome/photolyase family protein [Paenalkalicoccus suaedae]
MATLWILGHQCSTNQPWFNEINKEKDTILLIEARSRSTWQSYHKQKLVLIFSIMRHFKEELEDQGYKVDYRKADSFEDGITKHCNQYKTKELLVHMPSDDRMRKAINKWAKDADVEVKKKEEGGFLIERDEWKDLLPDGEKWQLDKVYRELRKRFDILLTEDKKPIGGKWSYDADNRKKPKKGTSFEEPKWVKPDKITKEVIKDVEENYGDHYGETDSFAYPVTAKQAEKALDHFIEKRLSTFGDYQDAMLVDDPFVSHSLLSSSINANLLDPLEVIKKVEQAYHDDKAPLNAVEGFIRQLLGWREYIRGVYIRLMPKYKNVNELNHKRDLPEFYWTADTKMTCMKQSVGAVVEHGYSHHIQRLMVLGNFANLAGISPQQVSDWFNEMYVDAYDWVVLPNVLGMALHADGGVMSTKPYVSSGNYINKMSHYCGDCAYNVKEKYGEDACPFHALYWDFLERHEKKFRDNPRMKMVYKHVDNRSKEDEKKQKETVKLTFERMEKGEL